MLKRAIVLLVCGMHAACGADSKGPAPMTGSGAENAGGGGTTSGIAMRDAFIRHDAVETGAFQEIYKDLSARDRLLGLVSASIERLYREALAAPDLARVIVINDCPTFVDREDHAFNICGGMTQWTDALLFVRAEDTDGLMKIVDAGSADAAQLEGKSITTTPAAVGTYGVYLRGVGGKPPAFTRTQVDGKTIITLGAPATFEPKIGVMIYALPVMQVSKVLAPTARAEIDALVAANRSP